VKLNREYIEIENNRLINIMDINFNRYEVEVWSNYQRVKIELCSFYGYHKKSMELSYKDNNSILSTISVSKDFWTGDNLKIKEEFNKIKLRNELLLKSITEKQERAKILDKLKFPHKKDCLINYAELNVNRDRNHQEAMVHVSKSLLEQGFLHLDNQGKIIIPSTHSTGTELIQSTLSDLNYEYTKIATKYYDILMKEKVRILIEKLKQYQEELKKKMVIKVEDLFS